MLPLHPPADHIPLYWSVFKERVDPLVKVLHIPTTEPTVLESRNRLDQIHRGLETLLFAVYYGAVTSLSNEDVREKFGEDKFDLVTKYKFGCEQALARADFLQTDEMIVLQAFVTFLICLRRNDDARTIWTLTGLVVRMAQTLGLHRDGGHYDLTPFDIEMRRRLWWQICILDSRASEDHGCDPTITEQSFDTQMPLNVDDIDLCPSMASFPEPKLGCNRRHTPTNSVCATRTKDMSLVLRDRVARAEGGVDQRMPCSYRRALPQALRHERAAVLGCCHRCAADHEQDVANDIPSLPAARWR
jgi:hypothetical protein